MDDPNQERKTRKPYKTVADIYRESPLRFINGIAVRRSETLAVAIMVRNMMGKNNPLRGLTIEIVRDNMNVASSKLAESCGCSVERISTIKWLLKKKENAAVITEVTR